MPNEFDKILNDKLKGYETDFNPADWQKMEAMLPQDSRKFFLVIASLFTIVFLGTGILTLNNVLNSDGREMIPAKAMAEQGRESEPGYGGVRYVPNKAAVSGMQQGSVIPPKDDENAAEMESVNKKVDSKAKTDTHLNAESNPVNSNHQVIARNEIEASDATQIAEAKNTDKRSMKNENKIGKAGTVLAKKEGNRATLNKTDNYSMNGKQRMTAATIAANDPPDESAEALAILGSGMISSRAADEDQQIPSLESSEVSVFRKKKKVFAFALGAGAGPIFSFIDPNYLSKPGYTTAISQEFMFIQRIGLVLSESYAHRQYDGGQYPCAPGLDCPQSYSSDVKSIDFGIDVKANLVHKARWDWYATAGVINALKLHETFEYDYPRVDTMPLPNAQGLSTSTNFNGGSQFENLDAISGGVNALPDEPDLTISGNKRYHAAYHFATGFNVLLNSKMKLQFDAGYAFTQRTVGEKEQRLQDVGVNGRMFLLFGK